MKDFCTMGCNHCHLSADSKKEIEQIKKEAVKEFAEKYKIILNDRSIRSARYLKEEFYKLLKEYEV